MSNQQEFLLYFNEEQTPGAPDGENNVMPDFIELELLKISDEAAQQQVQQNNDANNNVQIINEQPQQQKCQFQTDQGDQNKQIFFSESQLLQQQQSQELLTDRFTLEYPKIQEYPLLVIINNYLQGIEPIDQELQMLNDEEYVIFESLKEKKGNELQKNKKRVEEKQKLIFKKAFKHIEKKFFEQNSSRKKRIHKKEKNYKRFYEYYFSGCANKFNIDIRNFYHPQKNPDTKSAQKKYIPGQKSFNQAYIDIILRSQKFREQVNQYIAVNFIEEANQERIQKIDKFLKKCYSIIDQVPKDVNFLFQDSDNKNFQLSLKNVSVEKLKYYILKNSKCKIPWTLNELQEVKALGLTFLEKTQI